MFFIGKGPIFVCAIKGFCMVGYLRIFGMSDITLWFTDKLDKEMFCRVHLKFFFHIRRSPKKSQVYKAVPTQSQINFLQNLEY